MNEYERQSNLLLEVLPVFKNDSFALKGGTAINFFYRDAPRLSVDIDLVYVPIEDRQTSYQNINTLLFQAIGNLENLGYQVRPQHLVSTTENKLVVSKGDIFIKVEPNFIVRGTAFGVEQKEIYSALSSASNKITFPCVSFHDVFGGKICAALERQHPRDLFDIKFLLENEGVTDKLKDAFLYYLISAKRPYHEILNPNQKDISATYEKTFVGMSKTDVSIDELNKAFLDLKYELGKCLTENDIGLLVSTLRCKPEWDLSAVSDLGIYPSVKWRMLNINKMASSKREDQISKLTSWFDRIRE